ncbi:MAG: YD repeat-containing protein [Acidobacteriota bacterium]|nr:YD repeat-containing protein [Acidobacteriota bacterium]
MSFSNEAFAYDANGNLLKDGTHSYQWNAENRLIAVSQNGQSATFSYDGLGRRIAIDNNGSETRYLWCGSTLCQGRTSTDTVTRRYYPVSSRYARSQLLTGNGSASFGPRRRKLSGWWAGMPVTCGARQEREKRRPSAIW